MNAHTTEMKKFHSKSMFLCPNIKHYSMIAYRGVVIDYFILIQ